MTFLIIALPCHACVIVRSKKSQITKPTTQRRMPHHLKSKFSFPIRNNTTAGFLFNLILFYISLYIVRGVLSCLFPVIIIHVNWV